MMLFTTFQIVVSTMVFTMSAAQKACFYPDGKNATGLVVCKPDADVSHCCREADMCLSNGMCFSSGLGSIVRRACTDKTWKSADCPNVCNIDMFRSGDAVLTPCGTYNNFCCGQDEAARSCCNEGNATLTAQIAGGDLISSLTPVSNTVSGTSSPTSTNTGPLATGTSMSTEASSKSLESQRIAFICLTAIFGILMFAAFVWAIIFRRRMKTERREKLIKERDRVALQQERDNLRQGNRQLTQENQRLVQETHSLERAVAGLPLSFKRQVEAARQTTGAMG